MEQRLDYIKASPDGFKAMLALEKHITASLDHALLHLVKLLASQINGCAYCIDMHWKDARAGGGGGESEERLYMLDAWRESSLYTDRERAAFAWTEALTLVSETHAPDADFAAAREHFTEKELVDLTWAIAGINAWNRVAIGFRSKPGVYQAPKARPA